jgi:hypothetical protein
MIQESLLIMLLSYGTNEEQCMQCDQIFGLDALPVELGM